MYFFQLFLCDFLNRLMFCIDW
uniref:Uncharacterized protein n=1 Tax=Anguilla anguilla TaxID=7936 RepID=A0A0E9Q951_ANGAN